LAEAERKILWLWLSWRQLQALYEDISIEWPKNFEVDDLSQDLEHALAAVSLLSGAPILQREIKKSLARQILPSVAPEVLERGFDELEQEQKQGETIPPAFQQDSGNG